MIYNNKGYTIEIPDELYWSMTDDQFNEYINTKSIEHFNCDNEFTNPGTFILPNLEETD